METQKTADSAESLIHAVAPFARAELARRHLADLAELVTPSYQRAPHVELLSERLEAVERRDMDRLIVTMPPRYGKSFHAAQVLPAWWLGRHPEQSVIIASYSAELAEQHSRRARGLLLHPAWPFDVTVSPESAAVGRWNTTAGGGVRAAGVGGGITGFGAHLLVLDDLIRGRDDADSEQVRESTWQWLNEVALTRLMPGGAVVCIGTRWHEDDPIGRLLAQGGWEVLCLPAIAEEDDPLGRAPGEALWPAWFPLDVLERTREQLGPRSWAALYQQRPAPAEGNLFRREWLTGRFDRIPDGAKVITAVDSSFGKSVSSDFSAIVTVAADGRYFYVIDVRRGRWAFHELVARIKDAHAEHRPGEVVVEDSAAGQSAIQELHRQTDLPVVAVRPEGSKLARADSVTGLFEGGRVLFPSVAPGWRDELIEELASFPTGRHDDRVDALVYAIRRLRGRAGAGGGVLPPVLRRYGRVVRDGPVSPDDLERRRRERAERAREQAAAARKRFEADAEYRASIDPRYA